MMTPKKLKITFTHYVDISTGTYWVAKPDRFSYVKITVDTKGKFNWTYHPDTSRAKCYLGAAMTFRGAVARGEF